jgi:3-oxoacyl-[acyl-carrier protein] reductase
MDLGSIPPEMVSDPPFYVVVGASSALGRVVCSALVATGRGVLGTRNRGADLPAGVETADCDVTSADDCAALAGEAALRSARLSVVYLPGLSESSVLHRTVEKSWLRVVDVNLNGAFRIARAFLPGMRTAGYGRFAFAGSVTGRLGAPGTGSYSASKEGLRGLSRVIASENAARGVTANVLEIGYMDAGLTYTIPGETRDELVRRIPAGRYGDPAELASLLLLLEDASYVNGSVLTISGGL